MGQLAGIAAAEVISRWPDPPLETLKLDHQDRRHDKEHDWNDCRNRSLALRAFLDRASDRDRVPGRQLLCEPGYLRRELVHDRLRLERTDRGQDDLAVSHFGSVLVLMRRHVQIILRIRYFGSFLRSPAEFGLQVRLPVLRKSYLVRALQPASTMGLRPPAPCARGRPEWLKAAAVGLTRRASLALQED
jgi:hypothetical protein